MQRVALCITALMTVLVNALPAQEEAATEMPTMVPMEQAILGEGADEPYATMDGGAVTAADITVNLSSRQGYRENLRWTPSQGIDDMAREIAWERTFREEALAALSTQEAANLTMERRRTLQMLMLQGEVLKMSQVTDEECREHYEANLQNYLQPFSFHMRQLFLPCYEEATILPGETLSDVARRVHGDREAAREIRDVNHRPVVRGDNLTLDELDIRASLDLNPGDRLYVPMGNDARREVRNRLRDIRAGLETEEDFIAACKEHTSSEGDEVGPLPDNDNFLPELLEMGQTLPLGEISDVIETKHGFQLLIITQRVIDEPKPFEEVIEDVHYDIRLERTSEAVEAWAADLAKRHGAEITQFPVGPMAAVARMEGRLADLGNGREITAESLVQAFNNLSPMEKSRWRNHGRNFLLDQLLVVHTDILDREYEQREDLHWAQKVMESVDLIGAVQPYLTNLFLSRAEDITEEQVREYFEVNKQNFREPTRVDAHLINQRLPTEKTLAELNELAQPVIENLRAELADVTTLAEFIAKIPELSEDVQPDGANIAVSRRNNMPTNSYPEIIQTALDEAEPGSFIGPIHSGRLVTAMWVENKVVAETPSFEEVQGRVRTAMVRERYHTMRREARAEYLDSVNFSILRETEETE